jgi:hypothetical protein
MVSGFQPGQWRARPVILRIGRPSGKSSHAKTPSTAKSAKKTKERQENEEEIGLLLSRRFLGVLAVLGVLA